MNTIFLTVLKRRIICFNVLQRCSVHHHKESEDMDLFMGIKRSNPQKANRNTHVNERKFRKVYFDFNFIIE